MSGEKDNKDSKFFRSDQRGQIMIEYLLLALVSLGLLSAALKYFRDTRTLDQVANTTWSGVAQMSEYGNWPTPGDAVHPNSSKRTRTWDPQR